MKPHLKNVCFVRFSQGDKRCCWIGSHWLDLAVISSALKSKVIFLFSNPSHFPGFSCVYLFLLLFQSPSVLWIRIQTSCVISVYQLHLRLTPTMSDWPSEKKKLWIPSYYSNNCDGAIFKAELVWPFCDGWILVCQLRQSRSSQMTSL